MTKEIHLTTKDAIEQYMWGMAYKLFKEYVEGNERFFVAKRLYEDGQDSSAPYVLNIRFIEDVEKKLLDPLHVRMYYNKNTSKIITNRDILKILRHLSAGDTLKGIEIRHPQIRFTMPVLSLSEHNGKMTALCRLFEQALLLLLNRYRLRTDVAEDEPYRTVIMREPPKRRISSVSVLSYYYDKEWEYRDEVEVETSWADGQEFTLIVNPDRATVVSMLLEEYG